MAARNIDKILATDTAIGAAAVVAAWAVTEFMDVEISILEAGAAIVLAQTIGHKLADWLITDRGDT